MRKQFFIEGVDLVENEESIDEAFQTYFMGLFQSSKPNNEDIRMSTQIVLNVE